MIEPRLEAIFDPESFGYHPDRSAHDALTVTKRRCWGRDWVLEYDIKGLFDNIPHDLLLKAARVHIKEKWIVMYVERWLTAPMILTDGTEIKREKGAPQGSVIYGKFYPSQLRGLSNYIDQRLAWWAKLKFKSLGGSQKKSWKLIERIRGQDPKLFAHWRKFRSMMGAV